MHLLIRKSQRDDGWFASSMVFIIEARLELDAEEQELFERYRLFGTVVYDSNARVQQQHSAVDSYEASQHSASKIPWFPTVEQLPFAVGNLIASLWHFTAGEGHTLLSELSLQITLGSLCEGQHIESESLAEILQVAKLIEDSIVYLSNYLGLALTFDGREELNAF